MTPKDNILFSSEAPEGVVSGSRELEKGLERRSAERLFPPQLESSELTLRCRRADYSASHLARAVEDCDAHLLNLNVTSLAGQDAADLIVDLRISHRNALAVARSLERYGYEVTEIVGLDDATVETVNDRLGLLMYNLDI